MRQLYYPKTLTLSFILAVVLFGFGSDHAVGAAITITNTNDTRPRSLRQVIGNSVDDPYLNDKIGFDLTGRPRKIRIQSSLDARSFFGGMP